MSSLVPESSVNYKSFPFHKEQEELVDILCSKTGKNERGFFRILVAYKFAEIASHMRSEVNYIGTEVPVNMYALDLSVSGFSKDASSNILDKKIFDGFKDEFQRRTFDSIAELNIGMIADELAILKSIDLMQAQREVEKEFHTLPSFLYSFGASTIEGYKALRRKLSMANVGATSYVIGEIGSAMKGNAETLTELLNTYDMGLSKQKLIKTDSNNDMRGAVPSNLFMFGTQSKLLDGGTIEDEFFDLLEEGYARRLMFGYVENAISATMELTPEEIYDIATDSTTDLEMATLSMKYKDLADVSKYGQKFTMSKDVTMMMIKYRQDCDKLAATFKPHEEIKKAIVSHGYWRAVKIAGAYAFIDGTTEVTEEQAKNAIALVESSNQAFIELSRRPAAYVKLIEYMADVNKEVTQVDLVENLPFYKGSEAQKKEMMTLAIAHGYRNKIVVRKTYADGVEFLKADRLEETDLNKIHISYSTDMTEGYKHVEATFSSFPQLVCAPGYHYLTHEMKDGYRLDDNAVPGFDLCVLDVDDGTSIKTAQALLSEYQYLMYETKRSTPEKNRFRIIIPLSHKLKLSKEDHKEFMKNVFEFMPFQCDEATANISRKWLSNKAEPIVNDGIMLDVYDFLPKTKKQEEMAAMSHSISSSDSVQKFFLMNYTSTGRNVALHRYATMLLDSGHSADEAVLLVRDLNSKLPEPLNDSELVSTIFKTIYKKEAQMESGN